MRTVFLMFMFACVLVALLCGCGTTSKVWEFDKDGKAISYTETDADIVGSIIEATKNKTIIAWHSGWVFGVSGSPGTYEDPTPHVKLLCGKHDDGYISIKDSGKDTYDWKNIAKVIEATNKSLNVSATGAKED